MTKQSVKQSNTRQQDTHTKKKKRKSLRNSIRKSSKITDHMEILRRRQRFECNRTRQTLVNRNTLSIVIRTASLFVFSRVKFPNLIIVMQDNDDNNDDECNDPFQWLTHFYIDIAFISSPFVCVCIFSLHAILSQFFNTNYIYSKPVSFFSECLSVCFYSSFDFSFVTFLFQTHDSNQMYSVLLLLRKYVDNLTENKLTQNFCEQT